MQPVRARTGLGIAVLLLAALPHGGSAPAQQPPAGTPGGQQQGPPAIRGFNPQQGTQGSTLGLTITGANFRPGIQLQFQPPTGIQVLGINVVSPNQIQAQLRIDASAPPGPRQLELLTQGGQGPTMTASTPFVVVPAQATPAGVPQQPGQQGVPPERPAIRAFSPQQGAPCATLGFTITGVGFRERVRIQFDPPPGIQVSNVVVVSPNQIQAQVSIDGAAQPGPRRVSVGVGDYSATAQMPFVVLQGPGGPCPGAPPARELPAPNIVRISPNQVPAGAENRELVIFGQNFAPGAQVSFSGSGIFPLGIARFVNATEIHVNINVLSSALPGGRDVSVTNPNRASGLGRGMLNITPAAVSRPPRRAVTGPAVAVVIKPPATIELKAPNDGTELWNFFAGAKHSYSFAWKEAPKEKSRLYEIRVGKEGADPILKVQVEALNWQGSRRSFENFPHFLSPAQVFKLSAGVTYTWEVYGYDDKGNWVARTIKPRKFIAGIYFSDKLDCDISVCDEASIEPPVPLSKSVQVRVNEPAVIRVRYAMTRQEAFKQAQVVPAAAEQTSDGGGDTAPVTAAKVSKSPVADSLFKEYGMDGKVMVPYHPVQIRDPFGGGYAGGDVCNYWTWIDYGDGTPPEAMTICKGWYSENILTAVKQHKFLAEGEYTLKVYTERGGFYHLMACLKVKVEPPPCTGNEPLELDKADPFRLTLFQGFKAGEQPTVKTYSVTTPRPVAELRYRGKGSVAIEWSVDGVLMHTQNVTLNPNCGDPRPFQMDRDLPRKLTDLPPAGKGAHIISARIVSIAGNASATKESGGKFMRAAAYTMSLGGTPSSKSVATKSIHSYLDLMKPAPIKPVESPTTLKYNVDDTPPPPDVPVQITFPTSNSGKFILVDLSDDAKVAGGKVSGKGTIQMMFTDQPLNVLVDFKDLEVTYDGSTHLATVTGGSIHTTLSGTSFSEGNFSGELTEFKVDTTAATLGGSVTLPAGSGLRSGGKATAIAFSGAEYVLERSGDAPSFGHLYKDGLALPKSDVFSSGFSLTSSSVTVDFSKLKGTGPGAECPGPSAGAGNAFMGIVLGSGTKISPPALVFGDALAKSYTLSLDNSGILSVGFSRRLKTIPINKSASLFEFKATLDTADLDWCGTGFAFTLDGTLKQLPLFSNDLKVKVTLAQDGSFSASASKGTVGPVKVGPLTMKGTNLNLEFTSGVGVRVKLDLDTKIDLGASSNFGDLPFKDVRISPRGELTIGSGSMGGWTSLGKSFGAKFYGFEFSLKEVGAGVEVGSGGSMRMWLGTSGGLKLGDFIPVHVGASADKIRFYLRGSGGAFFFDGVEVDKIGLDFDYAAVKFKGSVGWKGNPSHASLDPATRPLLARADGSALDAERFPYAGPVLGFVPADVDRVWGGAGPYYDPLPTEFLGALPEPATPLVPPPSGESSRFFGDINLSIVGLAGGKAGFLVGNESGKLYFLARLTFQLGSGIPLGPTGLSLYMIQGGVGYRVAWGQLGYQPNFANPCEATSVGGFDTPLESVTYDPGRAFTLKAGVGVGTADGGMYLYLQGVFSLVVPGPSISVDAGAWVLGADRGSSPQGCGHIGYYDETFNASLGVDLTLESLVRVTGLADIQFGKAGWHIYIGKPESRVTASVVGIGKAGGANGYLDVDNSGIRAGVGVSSMVGRPKTGDCFQIYGYCSSGIEASLAIYLYPLSADASYEYWVSGGLGVRAFCVSVGADTSAHFWLKGHIPPIQLCGGFDVSGEVCFVFCKSFSVGISVCMPP